MSLPTDTANVLPMAFLLAQTAVGIALSALFALAAHHKLKDRPRFQAQLADYRLVPAALVAPATLTLAAAEIVTALALLMQNSWHWSGPLAATLLLLYGAAIGINLLRGRAHIDCGCGDTPQLLSGWLLLRNAAMALAAALLAWPLVNDLMPRYWLLVGALPVAATLMLTYAAAAALLENASALGEWRSADESLPDETLPNA